MEIIYSSVAQEDLLYWKRSGNKTAQTKITLLIKSISQTPYEGAGKPEALKHELAGKWSRRINREHRLVYSVVGNSVHIHSLREHYKR